MASTMRIGGLVSGLDVDDLVKKLMSAERAPLDKLQQKQQTYEWTRDAYRSVNTKLQTFDTYLADNLVLKSLISKTATSSNSSLVEATASGSATGTLSIEGVSQLASAARKVGSQVNAIGTTTLGDLFANSGVNVNQNYIEIRAIQKDGTLASKATKIEFTENMTINDFVSKVNNSGAGVTAVFENGKLSITAKNTGDIKGGAEIVVDSGKEVFEAFGFTLADGKSLANNGKNAIFQVNGIATERSTNTFSLSGYNITLKDTFNSVQTIAEKYNAAKLERDNAITNYNNKQTQLTNKTIAYYGSTTATGSYTSDHNSAYLAAFGVGTLSLSQQEIYSKLGSVFWRNLSSDEMNLLENNIDPNDADPLAKLKSAIEGSNFDNLKSLKDDQLQALISLSQTAQDAGSDVHSEILSLRFQAYYDKHASKLKNLEDPSSIGQIQAFIGEIDFDNDDLDSVRTKIENFGFNEEVKDLLSSLTSMDELTEFVLTSTVYTEKAEASDLKSKYSALGGDSFFNKLTPQDIAEINSVDLKDPDASISPELAGKLNGLTDDQLEILNNLSDTQLTNFQALAVQNVNRNNYLKADNEFKAAETRKANAEATYATALADAQAANILKSVGADNYEIDDDKVNNTPKANAVNLTSSTNADDIVAKIKDFVNTYNGLILELNTLYKEKKDSAYPPLTDAQKEEMEKDEIEKWEAKAKTGLLRNDSIIQSALSGLRALVYESNPAVANSKYNTLYSIGITTSNNYNDGGTLTIDENKLRAAIEADPDAVLTLFSNSSGKKDDTVTVNGEQKTADTRGYVTKLREVLTNTKLKIEKKAGRTTMTENSYSLGKSLIDIKNQIENWKKKLEDIESRYWKQFTSLETSVNKYNSYSSLFTQAQ